MTRETVNAICAALPGAEVSEPFGPGIDTWKVGGKIFACRGLRGGVAIKTDGIETAEMLIDAGVGTKAPYFHRSWVLLPEAAEADELAHRIRASYRIVRDALPRKARAALPPLD